MRRWNILACILIGMALPPLSTTAARPAGGGTLLLRYRFVAGQHLAYRVATVNRVTFRLDYDPRAHRAPIGGLRQLEQRVVVVQERVVGVAATGTATITERAGNVTVTRRIHGGRRTYTTPPGRVVSVTVTSDGTQHSLGPTDSTGTIIGTATMGALPLGQVQVGVTWMSRSTSALTGRPIAVRNTLSGIRYMGGEPVAIVDSVRHIDDSARTTVYASVSELPPQLWVHEIGTETERVLVGLTAGHLVTRRFKSDIDLTYRGQQAGPGPMLRVHSGERTVMTRLGP